MIDSITASYAAEGQPVPNPAMLPPGAFPPPFGLPGMMPFWTCKASTGSEKLTTWPTATQAKCHLPSASHPPEPQAHQACHHVSPTISPRPRTTEGKHTTNTPLRQQQSPVPTARPPSHLPSPLTTTSAPRLKEASRHPQCPTCTQTEETWPRPPVASRHRTSLFRRPALQVHSLHLCRDTQDPRTRQSQPAHAAVTGTRHLRRTVPRLAGISGGGSGALVFSQREDEALFHTGL